MADELTTSTPVVWRSAISDSFKGLTYNTYNCLEHLNRLDVCKAEGTTVTQPQASAPNQQTTLTFGQPSSSAPAFGQPSAPSAFSRPSVPSFGQPSAPTSTFGQPSARSPLGAPQQQPNALEKPSGPGFLQQPSAAAKNPFGQPLAPAQTPTFGQPSALSQQSAFGRPSTLNPSPAFGQPATSGAITGFSQTSIAPPNPFGQPTAPLATAVNRANVRSTSGQGTNGVQVQKDSQDKITSWKGMPVRYFDDELCYKGDDGSWQGV
ncbi:hypothetical protein HO133_003349 [Letharia lupina]|uniref:Uncharacterized protein n=1 Tax=Letharia lupina TaxID=560253 RepID=A0A8H6CB14_9LECA|nr:uncharacterized protein HO133_003349 [Letharia lupina]KAF6220217.1 hypothetical protein HO133_003349 [Letharia lupina]